MCLSTDCERTATANVSISVAGNGIQSFLARAAAPVAPAGILVSCAADRRDPAAHALVGRYPGICYRIGTGVGARLHISAYCRGADSCLCADARPYRHVHCWCVPALAHSGFPGHAGAYRQARPR